MLLAKRIFLREARKMNLQWNSRTRGPLASRFSEIDEPISIKFRIESLHKLS
jgi:hypothetical protein